jgi:DNA-binding transcriptional ArsR family regulator
MQEHLSITEPEVARALTESKSVQHLVPFMKRPLSLSEAAKELGVKLPKLSYHVKRLLGLGLLEVACTERRGRRGVKLYQSTARSFFIPFHLTPSASLEQLVTSLTAPEAGRFRRELARTLQRISPDWGLQVARTERGDRQNIAFSITQVDAEGHLSFDKILLGPEQPALFSTEGKFTFDFDTAKAFQKEMSDLAERYADRQSDRGQPYSFRLGLTPMQDDSLE